MPYRHHDRCQIQTEATLWNAHDLLKNVDDAEFGERVEEIRKLLFDLVQEVTDDNDQWEILEDLEPTEAVA